MTDLITGIIVTGLGLSVVVAHYKTEIVETLKKSKRNG